MVDFSLQLLGTFWILQQQPLSYLIDKHRRLDISLPQYDKCPLHSARGAGQCRGKQEPLSITPPSWTSASTLSFTSKRQANEEWLSNIPPLPVTPAPYKQPTEGRDGVFNRQCYEGGNWGKCSSTKGLISHHLLKSFLVRLEIWRQKLKP